MITNTLKIFLRKTEFNVFAQGMQVRLPETKNYFYPDVVVTQEKVTAATSIEKPLLIAEVLSLSTCVNDLTDKFIAYRQIPTLLYYLLVEPSLCSVTLIYRGENDNWESEVYYQLTAVIPLPKLAVELSVRDIYDGVEWA